MIESNKKCIKLLWFSAMAPYDSVNHAGGKTHNFYTKSFGGDKRFDVTLLTYCLSNEEEKVRKEFAEYNIKTELVVHPSDRIRCFFWKAVNAETVLNPFNRYAGLTRNQTAIRMIRHLRKMKQNGYKPDLIFLHWTQINLLAKKVKKIFPDSKIVEMEVDVTYQAYERRLKNAENYFKKWFWNHRFNKMKHIEIQSLRLADALIINNCKDAKLLQDEGLNQPLFKWTPFFQSMLDLKRCCDDETNRDILFYGAMGRDENWRSAIWFIENVLNKLRDLNVCLKIVGSHPNDKLKKYQADNVEILGFVEDIGPFFSQSMCLVAPLLLGAGIKVKVIEGLSAGIPVLTNHIGIEGIPAEDGSTYIHCEQPDDYVNAIKTIINNEVNVQEMEKKAKVFVENNLNFKSDAIKLRDWLYSIK